MKDLELIQVEVQRIKVLTDITRDIHNGLEVYAIEYENKKTGSASYLAYETNRVLEHLVELNDFIADLARNILDADEE